VGTATSPGGRDGRTGQSPSEAAELLQLPSGKQTPGGHSGKELLPPRSPRWANWDELVTSGAGSF